MSDLIGHLHQREECLMNSEKKTNYSKLTIVGAFAEEQSPENVEIVTDLVNLLVIVSTQTPNPYNGLLLQGSNVGNISTQRVI